MRAQIKELELMRAIRIEAYCTQIHLARHKDMAKKERERRIKMIEALPKRQQAKARKRWLLDWPQFDYADTLSEREYAEWYAAFEQTRTKAGQALQSRLTNREMDQLAKERGLDMTTRNIDYAGLFSRIA